MQSFIFTGLQANSSTVANLYLPSVLWPSIHPQVQERTDDVGSVFSLLSFARSLLFVSFFSSGSETSGCYLSHQRGTQVV